MTAGLWWQLLPPLLLPLLVPPLGRFAAARALPDRMDPRTAVWALTAAAAGLAAAGLAALALLAGGALMHLPIVAHQVHVSLPLARRLAPGVLLPLGTAAGVVLAAALWSGVRTLRRQLREVAAARRAVARLAPPAVPAGRLVILADEDAADAYALPPGLRAPARIVITRGMLRALAPEEREVLLAHERAHLAGCHWLFLSLAELAAAVQPLLRPLREGVVYGVERWADERAASAVADRRLAARAIGRAALAGRQRTGASAGAAAGASAGVIAARPGLAPGAAAGAVPRRVAALLEAPGGADAPGRAPRRGRARLAAAVLVAVLTLSLGATLDSAGDFHAQVERAQAASVR